MKGIGPSAPSTLALLAATFFAAQHPLSKPALSAGGAIGLTVASIFLGLASLPIMFALGRGGKDFVKIMTQRDHLLHLLALGLVGWLSAVIYVVCIGQIHPVLASIFLNTSPIWSAIWTRVISKQKLPKFFVTVLFVFFGSIITAIYSNGFVSVVFPAAAIFIVAVPALYTFRSHMLYWWFREMSPLEVLSAGSVVSGLMSIVPLSICWIWYPDKISIASVSPTYWVMLILGTACLIVGSSFYQLAIKATGGNSAYVTAFNLLIPSLSALYVWIIFWTWPITGLEPEPIYFMIIVPVTVSLAAFALVNERARRLCLRSQGHGFESH